MHRSFQLMQSKVAPNVDVVQPGLRRSPRSSAPSTSPSIRPHDKSTLGVNSYLRE